MTNVNGTVFFRADDGTHGRQLWESNGAAAGTHLVADINPTGGAYPRYLTNVSGTLFFQATDGTHGTQLWASNGAAADTHMVADVNAGPVSFDPAILTNVSGLLFFTANDSTHGLELWKSNGTALGTSLVADIFPGPPGSYVANLTNVSGTLFFTASDGVHGKELWRSNGAIAGTVMVKDIHPGSGDSVGLVHANLVNVNGTLFFGANDGIHGTELWQSNGTATGTVMVKDINAGSAGSYPYYLANSNGTLFFSANDGIRGVEPWILGPLPAHSGGHASPASGITPATADAFFQNAASRISQSALAAQLGVLSSVLDWETWTWANPFHHRQTAWM